MNQARTHHSSPLAFFLSLRGMVFIFVAIAVIATAAAVADPVISFIQSVQAAQAEADPLGQEVIKDAIGKLHPQRQERARDAVRSAKTIALGITYTAGCDKENLRKFSENFLRRKAQIWDAPVFDRTKMLACFANDEDVEIFSQNINRLVSTLKDLGLNNWTNKLIEWALSVVLH